MTPASENKDQPEEDDLILFSVSCLRHKGLIAYSGVLELTLAQLRFRPLSGSNRVNTNLSVLIPTEYIRSADIRGSEGHLIFRVGKEKLRFSGLNVRRFSYRLGSLIANIRGLEALEIPHFNPEERVLAFAEARITRTEEGKSRGEVVLTDSRLRFFEYKARRTGEVNPMPIYQVGLEQIQHFQFEGLTQKLRVDSGMGTVRINGSVTPTLFALLSNLCRPADPDDDPDMERSTLARTGPATRVRGLRTTQGLLVMGGDTIQFVPTGIINMMMGSRPVTIPFSQLYQTRRGGTKSTRMELQGEEQPLKLRLEDCEGWYNELITQVQDWLEKRTQAGNDGTAGSRLGSWRFKVNRQAIEDAPLVLPVVRRDELQMNAMILSHSRSLVRLAFPGDGMDAPFLTLDSLDLQRTWDDLADSREILFSHKKERFILTAAGGAPSVDDFWMRCRTPSRVFTKEYLEDLDWEPIIGTVQYLEVIPESSTPIKIRPSRILKHSDGLAMVIPGDSEECGFLGHALDIHFSHSEGMCELESLAIWASSVPSSISIPSRKQQSYMLLVIEKPEEIRAFNARRSFRVPAVQRVSLIRVGHPEEDMQNVLQNDWVEIGDSFDGTLLNISALGCAIVCDSPLDVDSRVKLTLTIEARPLPVNATVSRNREVEDEEGEILWEHGLEFLELNRIQTNTITKAVRQVQLHLLAQQEQKS